MTSTLPRSSVIQPSDTVRLRALFKGSDGLPTDLDAFPMITIVQPNGGVSIGPTSAGVYHEGTGIYGYDYDVCLNPPIGVWTDIWMGALNGFSLTAEFQFQVNTTELPAINTDGYVHLGDDPGFNYSQNAIQNINTLIKMLKARLNSSGLHLTKDSFGNKIYENCDIFTIDQLVSFLAYSLEYFNQLPTFTLFTWEDTPIIDNFGAILVQGASIFALSAQAAIERGREFQITDNGIGFTPPTISELLMSQYQTELATWKEIILMIKKNMKPAPLGLGTLSMNSGMNPQVKRIKNHLRQRQIF